MPICASYGLGQTTLPDADLASSIYLRDQVRRAELENRFVFIDELNDLEAVYASADAMALTARMDPMPNTAIAALTRGCPVVCFDKASGIAEVLGRDEDLKRLVVPYLDVDAHGTDSCFAGSDTP